MAASSELAWNLDATWSSNCRQVTRRVRRTSRRIVTQLAVATMSLYVFRRNPCQAAAMSLTGRRPSRTARVSTRSDSCVPIVLQLRAGIASG